MDKKQEDANWYHYHYAGQLVIESMIETGYEHEWEAEALRRLAGLLTQKKFRGIAEFQESGFPLPGGVRKNHDFIRAKEILNRIYSTESDRNTSLSMAIDKVTEIIDQPAVWNIIETVTNTFLKSKGPFDPRNIEKLLRAANIPSVKPRLVKRRSKVPSFRQYWPTVTMMNRKQRTFYKSLVEQLDNNMYPDVEGNISYLFVYTYTIFEQWKEKGFEWFYRRLLELSVKMGSSLLLTLAQN